MSKKPVLTKKDVLEFLKDKKLMVLATHGDYPWIASVFYSFDKDLSIYFISAPSTLHGKQMENNKKVAAAIVDSHQKPSDAKKGLQIYGTVEQISGINKISYAIRLWKDFLNVQRPDISFENMKKGLYKGRIYKLTPKKIKLFDQDKFKVPDGEEPILEL
ncbi:pyridoxamine 5'-phosphate oxidase family protein [Patescibacteria group bacterium]|nr:pyridoxamine 5'-phosphate oxidase family protein [Patescibacteria group bacterium]